MNKSSVVLMLSLLILAFALACCATQSEDMSQSDALVLSHALRKAVP